ncbi:MAG: hypothetical protein DRQ40_08660, partial [Gammaproteobacteria bacterium]
AVDTFVFWDKVELTAADAGINANGTFTLALSSEHSNSPAGNPMLKMVMTYDGITPDFGSVPQTFDIDCVIEGKNGNEWFPVAYQFAPFRKSKEGRIRILSLEPSVAGFDAGVDDVMFVGDTVEARVSRQQGRLPATSFRVRVSVTERDYGGPGSFQEVCLSGFGEVFGA